MEIGRLGDYVLGHFFPVLGHFFLVLGHFFLVPGHFLPVPGHFFLVLGQDKVEVRFLGLQKSCPKVEKISS